MEEEWRYSVYRCTTSVAAYGKSMAQDARTPASGFEAVHEHLQSSYQKPHPDRVMNILLLPSRPAITSTSIVSSHRRCREHANADTPLCRKNFREWLQPCKKRLWNSSPNRHRSLDEVGKVCVAHHPISSGEVVGRAFGFSFVSPYRVWRRHLAVTS